MIKKIMAMVIAVFLIAGCTYNAPTRTFQAKGMNCSETGMSFQISDKVADLAEKFGPTVFTNTPTFGELPTSEDKNKMTLEIYKEFMEICRRFLSDEKID